MFIYRSPTHTYSHWIGLMTFKFTQLLFLADRDIMYRVYDMF